MGILRKREPAEPNVIGVGSYPGQYEDRQAVSEDNRDLRRAIRTALDILADRKSMTAKELASVREVLRAALEN